MYKDLPPITLPEGKRTEGTLLSNRRTVKRAPKSPFLKQLEKKQAMLLHPAVRAELGEDSANKQAAVDNVLRKLKPPPRVVQLATAFNRRRP